MVTLWLQGLFLNSNLNDIFPIPSAISACGLNISCEKPLAAPLISDPRWRWSHLVPLLSAPTFLSHTALTPWTSL